MKTLICSLFVAVSLMFAGCESTATSTRPEIDTATANLDEYLKAMPDKPVLAGYQYRLQKRIDQCYFEALRAMQFARQHVPTTARSFTITLVVREAGNIGATDAEMKRAATQEPVLATAAFNALAAANEKPEAFSDALKAEIGTRFVYVARFGIR